MPRILIVVGGLAVLLIVMVFIFASLGSKKASNPASVPNFNIPVSSSLPGDSGPSLDSSPSAVTNSQNFAVFSTNPADQATGVALNSPITFTFNRNFDTSTAAITFSPEIQFTVSAAGNSNTITVTPNGFYDPNTLYKVSVDVPSLNYSTTVSFTTVNVSPAPSPTDTPTPTPSPS